MTVVKAINGNIEPISLTREEVLDNRIKHFESVNLDMIMTEFEIEREAEKWLPIWNAELIVREIKLGKKSTMWTDEQYEEFGYYFANKYINHKKGLVS